MASAWQAETPVCRTLGYVRLVSAGVSGAGRFRGPLGTIVRWLGPQQAVPAMQLTARFPHNRGGPIHIGDPVAIGTDLKSPCVRPAFDALASRLVPESWSCGAVPHEAALQAGSDITGCRSHAHGFVTDLPARDLALP